MGKHSKICFSTILSLLFLSVTVQSKSCLWKASSDSGTFYLLGSIHLLQENNYPLDPAIEAAYTASDGLVFETDLSQMESPGTQIKLMKKAILPEGRTLKDELNPKIYERLDAELVKVALSADAMKQFKPWFVTTTLSLLHTQAMKLDPELGIDQHFHQKALEDEKIEIGLESIDFQINLFDSLSELDQNAFTTQALDEIAQTKAMLSELIKAWETGNLTKLNKLLIDAFDDYPSMYKSFITDRNKDWIPKLKKLADKEKTYMVIVGAGHLAGKEGILELLKAEGYIIEQL